MTLYVPFIQNVLLVLLLSNSMFSLLIRRVLVGVHLLIDVDHRLIFDLPDELDRVVHVEVYSFE